MTGEAVVGGAAGCGIAVRAVRGWGGAAGEVGGVA